MRTDGRSLPARASMSTAPPKPAGAAPVAASSENCSSAVPVLALTYTRSRVPPFAPAQVASTHGWSGPARSISTVISPTGGNDGARRMSMLPLSPRRMPA